MIPVSVWIMLGGALGSLGRYGMQLWAEPISHLLPWGTIAVDIAGSFLIGFFGTLTLEDGRFPVPEPARLFVMVGFCGGFTTFSSFSLQTFDLFLRGGWSWALLHVGMSVVLCVGATGAGHGIASRLNRGAVRVAQNAVEEEAS